MTYVTVIPRVRFRAWNGEEPCDAPLGEVLPLDEALAREYTADACILQYAPPDVDASAQFPRLTKAALAYFELGIDPMPELNYVLVDVDYADHEVPPDGWAEEIVAKSPWNCGWYRTPHGLRLIYEPDREVPINLADSYLSQFHEKLVAAGVPADEATKDWTRLFKAPHALGYDLPFDYSGIEPIPWHPEELEEADPLAVGPIVDRDFRTAYDTAPDKLTRADLKPLGKSRLAELLYKGRLSAPVGQRHATLLDAARKIVAGYDTEDPMIPFHLLIEAAVGMRKEPEELWRICEWTCAHASGVKIEREEAVEEATKDMSDAMGCDPTEVFSRIIVDAGKEFYIWDEGRMEYSTGYTSERQLLGALARHAPNLAYGYYSGKVPTKTIMRDLSTVADRVVFKYHDDGPLGYDKTTYTFYRRLCKQDRSLTPEYDADVARWLAALFEAEEDHGLDWLASLPDLARPTCALYIHGPPSVGKGMLAAGVARIWSKECAVTPYSELLGTFNSTLKRSPIIHADEKVPQDVFAANDSSVFRRIIGNSGLPVRDLYAAPATLDGCPRVLITANNEDALAIREELNVADLDAIRLRIGYIRAGEEAETVLNSMAAEQGFVSTREMTESWVAGGRIAEHVLWLAENRPIDQGDRLLVEGWDSELTRSLSTSAGASGIIAEVIALMISDKPNMRTDAVRWFDDHVFVNNTELGRIWKYVLANDAERPPNSTRRLKALRALAGEERQRLSVYEDGGDTRRQLSYWKIPAETIARLARERNICPEEVILEAASRREEPEAQETKLTGFSAIREAKKRRV